MNLSYLFGIFLGALAALSLNIGKGVQKQKVHVFLQGRNVFQPRHRRDLGIWFVGMGLTAIAALPYSLALKLSESPSSISAMTGVGLVGLTIYALRVIGEKLSRTEALGVGLVVLGTSMLGCAGAGRETLARSVDTSTLLSALGVLLGFALLAAVAAKLAPRIHGIAFGLSAGVFLGSSLFLGDVALVRAGGDFIGQLSNPYPYAALGVGLLAMFTTQLGFLKGRALEVVPAVNSATILMPVILEYVIYGTGPGPLNVVMIGAIVGGVVLLSTGAAAQVSGAKPDTVRA